MTGETAKGRSISDTNSDRPRNLNFVTSQAAETPKSVLSGTEMPAANKVSLIAESAASSCSEAKKTSQPLRKASTNTAASGRSRNKARNATAVPINSRRTRGDSVVTGRRDMEA